MLLFFSYPCVPQSVTTEVLGCFQDGEPFIANITQRLRAREPLPSLVFIGAFVPLVSFLYLPSRYEYDQNEWR